MTERAVPSVPLAASNLAKTGDTVDEKGEKPDRYGEWLADDARIWRVYERLAKQDDDEKVKRWSGGLNNLAIFATLFSGITTAFIIESQGDLKPDFSELAYRVQNATAHGRTYVEEPFVVSGQARLVNCLWITSLILSLSAALISVMGQDWVEMYVDKPVCNARQWAEIRSFRLHGVYRWYMPGVIATAPVLLHASLFLFGIGLAVFMTSDVVTRNLCIALCAVVAFLYLVIMFSPVLWSSSPFRSPATMLIRRWLCARFQRKDDKDSSPAENAARRHITHCVADICPWIIVRLSGLWTAFKGTLAHYGSTLLTRYTIVFRRWSCASGNPSSRNSHGGAMIDPEAPRPAPETQYPAPAWLSHDLSMFLHEEGAAAPGWVQNLYSTFRGRFSRILDNYGPDVSNGWLDFSEKPSPALVADSLSWLSSASSSPDVAQLVILGLCDHVTGLEAGKHPNARSLTRKLRQYADSNWDHMSTLVLSRYLSICANAGQGDWPARVRQWVIELRDAETSISQEILLAFAHLTGGFQHITFDEVEHWCARIVECNPTALSAFASIIARSRKDPNKDLAAMGILIVLMNKWRDALPSDLTPVDRAFQAMLPKEVGNHRNKLTIWCRHGVKREPQPIDSILHSLVAFFVRHHGEQILVRLTRELIFSLALRSRRRHPCLAALFGHSDPDITKAAWTGLPGHNLMSSLQKALFFMSAKGFHHDLQPRLACTIARCIWPPFPLLATSNISTQTALSHGFLLFQLAKDMSSRRAVPEDDPFRLVLEQGALAKLAAFLRESPCNGDDFLWVLGAIALWTETQSNTNARPALFESFISRPTTTGPDDAVWDLVDALGTALQSPVLPMSAARNFLSAMGKLRAVFPVLPVWKDIARKFGANKQRFREYDWWRMRQAVTNGTGFDPEELATEDLLRGAGAAGQRDESATSTTVSGTIEPASVGAGASAGTLARPVPQIAWIAAGATPEDGL